MVLNSETTIFGTTPSKSVNFDVRSKSEKAYGLSFPTGKDTQGGYFAKISGLELIKKNLTQLIGTQRGERFMLPAFGTNLKRYLFEPMDETLFNQIRREIVESLNKYARNVVVEKLQVFPQESLNVPTGQKITIKLFCRLREEVDTKFDIQVVLE